MSFALPKPQAAAPVSLEHTIETPENVVLSYPLAGPASRLVAYLVDFFIRIGLVLAVYNYVVVPLSAGAQGASIGLFLVVFFLVDWFYYGLSEGMFRGKTIGKHMCGLRVIQEGGYPIALWGAILRNLVRAADSLPAYVFPFYGVGLLTMLASGKFRRLGDLVARTVVIQERRTTVPREPLVLEKIQPLSRTDLGGYVPQPRTLALIEEFLGRRYVLTHQRGHAMASVLAEVLAKKLEYRGDPQLLERYPMAFLARVYATFHQVRDDDERVPEAAGIDGAPVLAGATR